MPTAHHPLLRVASLHHIVGEGELPSRTREQTDVIETIHEREETGARQTPVGWLETKDPAERSRHAHRAISIRTESDGQQARSDRRSRATRGAAGNPRQIVRISGSSIMLILSGKSVGELVHVECANKNSARILHVTDDGSVMRRRLPFAQNLRSSEGDQAADIEQVLYTEGHAA
jgi:hypothetical protein